MNLEAFTKLAKAPVKRKTVCVIDLIGPDRTLLYGYTVDRDTWHVYLQDGLIHLLVYKGDVMLSHRSAATWDAEDLVPNKRAYPESTDEAFAWTLHHLWIDVQYRPFSRDRELELLGVTYHGKTRSWDFHGV